MTQLLIGLYLTALCGADGDGWRHTVYSDSCADSGLANVFSIMFSIMFYRKKNYLPFENKMSKKNNNTELHKKIPSDVRAHPQGLTVVMCGRITLRQDVRDCVEKQMCI